MKQRFIKKVLFLIPFFFSGLACANPIVQPYLYGKFLMYPGDTPHPWNEYIIFIIFAGILSFLIEYILWITFFNVMKRAFRAWYIFFAIFLANLVSYPITQYVSFHISYAAEIIPIVSETIILYYFFIKIFGFRLSFLQVLILCVAVNICTFVLSLLLVPLFLQIA